VQQLDIPEWGREQHGGAFDHDHRVGQHFSADAGHCGDRLDRHFQLGAQFREPQCHLGCGPDDATQFCYDVFGGYTTPALDAGTYTYHCTIHVALGMQGTIVVR